MGRRKKKEESTPSFCLTLPMHCQDWQREKLDDVFRVYCYIYNNLLSDRLNALKQMERTRAWQNNQKQIASIYAEMKASFTKNENENEKIIACFRKKLKPFYDVRNKMISDYGFEDYAFQKRVSKWSTHYKGMAHSAVSQKVASSVWRAFDEYLYGNGKEIHFKKWIDFRSIEGKTNKTGIMFRDYKVKVYGMSISVTKHEKNLYEAEALSNRIKYCRIIRRPVKNGWRYFIQLVLEGMPPIKRHKDGTPVQMLGNGRVGIDIGTQTAGVVARRYAKLIELADKVQNIENQLRRVNRAMDRSRRATNPEMFDKDGQIVPIDKLPDKCLTKKGKRNWVESKRYMRLSMERRALYSKQAEIRELQHNTLANQLLSLGNEFYVEEMNFKALAKRSKETKKSKKTGKYLSEKRFGKSLANKAPAKFIEILSKKVRTLGGNFTKINTREAKASQYNHLNHEYNKKKLSQRWNELPDGRRIQRDLYSAFLIMNIAKDLKTFDKSLCDATYEEFVVYHDLEIERLKTTPMPSSAGVS